MGDLIGSTGKCSPAVQSIECTDNFFFFFNLAFISDAHPVLSRLVGQETVQMETASNVINGFWLPLSSFYLSGAP